MKPGDLFLTNDPWLGTGHLTTSRSSRRPSGRQVVALFAWSCHVVDIGGLGMARTAAKFEEGL